MITLALYRLPGATDNKYPYVVCNPPPKMIVTIKDKVFVIGKNIPKYLIVDYFAPEKVTKESVKNVGSKKGLNRSFQQSVGLYGGYNEKSSLKIPKFGNKISELVQQP